MCISNEPWTTHRSPSGVTVRLVRVPPNLLRALGDGDLGKARSLTDIELTPYLATVECRRVWSRRLIQIGLDGTEAPWITRIVVDAHTGAVVGRAGFHGKPDATGMVEIGYAIDPACRRQGYARASLETLLDAARSDPLVKTVRASVGPDNIASRGLVEQFAFRVVGEQWDEEDGLETVFELALHQGS
ncbi:GNAT family N-acetyltransferase [Paeniglutamicibacter sp. R2-26]|uniref:GNAT family N-acetyltransferase n=1 Tax=Paeniglutamicibacter sp. R2-26 TaxID=3144417 RepID=UPI003EE5D6DD